MQPRRGNTDTLVELHSRRAKYRNPNYEDDEIDALMRYLQIEDYQEFVEFVKNARKYTNED